MKRRMLAVICVLAIMLGVIAFSTAAQDNTTTYRVGYAITDINPWVNPDDHDEGVLPVPLGGYGDPQYRLTMGIADDDGEAGESGKEGLFATCIAVTDDDNTTMLFIAFDAINTDDDMVKAIREGIVAGVAADSALQATTDISRDQIMVSASHSHFAPDFSSITKARLTAAHGTETGTELWEIYSNYKTRVTQQMVDVALDSLRDRETVSEVKKTETDAKELTGYQLNGVRHYELTGYTKYNYNPIAALWGGSVYSYSGDELTWVAGDNFGSNRHAVELGIKLDEWSASSPKTSYGAISGYYVKTAQHVTEANDTLYTLEFSFDSGKDTIMLANWRGHTTINGALTSDQLLYYTDLTQDSRYNIKSKAHYVSGDYFNAFRNLMKQQGYDVAMINGAGGNINNNSYAFDPSVGTDGWGGNISWSRFFEAGSLTDINGANVPATDLPATAFGKLLVRVALADTDKRITTVCTPGQIRSEQVRYGLDDNDYGIDIETQIDAWTAAYQACEAAQSAGSAVYPYKYEHKDGTVCIINSRFHCSYIKSYIRRHTGQASESLDYAKYELNAIMLGEQIAFVSAPGEMFDYYDANSSRKNEDNDWLELIDEVYGTPFVLGYTNGKHGYLPNTLAFEYNADIENLGNGSYESNSAQFNKGDGEKIIEEFARLLAIVSGKSEITVKEAYCEACDAIVEWKPLLNSNNGDHFWYSGHYYLYEDINDANTCGKRIRSSETVCLDLNGHRLQTNERTCGRAFVVETSATLNVFDSSDEKTGVISGQGMIVSYNRSADTYSYENGGTIYVQGKGTLNLYGGAIERRIVQDPYYRNSYNADEGYYRLVENFGVELGGTIYVHATSYLNVYGGTIGNGAAASLGNCVYSQSTIDTNGGFVTLANDASAAEIYFKSETPQNYLTVSGTYTGRTALALQSAQNGQVIGKLADNGDISDAYISLADDSGLYVKADGTNLVITDEKPTVTMATNGDKKYPSLQDAIDDYTSGVIELKVADTGTVTVPENKTVTVELNGFDLNNVVANGTLYVKDSETDDFDVSDGKYGKITGQITGDVQAVPVTNGAGYLKITEDDNSVSFHKVELAVTDMVMSSSQVSIYYNCKFAGDQLVQGEVDQYGMAISLKGTPQLDAETKQFTADCQRSWFTQFNAGVNSGSSTRLYNIMKTTNGYLNNRNNAEAPVYFRAYIQLDDGTYLLGQDYGVGLSLRQLLEFVSTDSEWDELADGQKNDLVAMYQNYTRVFNGWNVDKLKNAIK